MGKSALFDLNSQDCLQSLAAIVPLWDNQVRMIGGGVPRKRGAVMAARFAHCIMTYARGLASWPVASANVGTHKAGESSV